ncbi:MAG: 50S ribosomal protein L18 [Candidatus Aenigmarchaeota archaeon]|nr:50S ribosomal protein L18 [Candidatus Aenigmarchaeota archaeon]
MRYKTFVVKHRRRREGRTDYKARLRLLRSGKPRLVVRRSNAGLLCQVVEYTKAGDKVIAFAHSRELKNYGWPGHGGNLPASYLTALLCAVKAKKKHVKEAVADLGLYPSTKGSRLYGAIKGAVDGGLQVPHSKDILPTEDRIKGAHIAAYAEKMKKEHHKEYEKRFSQYLKHGVFPEAVPEKFEQARQRILAS